MPTQAQINGMTFEQLQALGFPIATDAEYTTGLHVPGYDGSLAGSGIPGTTVSNNTGKGFFAGLGDFPLFQAFPSLTANSIIGGAKDTVGAIGNTASAVKSGIGFITDIPRVATTVIGGLLIAAAIFAIAGGSHRDVINIVKGP